jgi:hypothetical protein
VRSSSLLFGNGRKENALAFIEGIGYATVLEHTIYLFLQKLVFKNR